MKFEGTDIDNRIWHKAQLAQAVGISRTTLWRYKKRCEHRLSEIEGYSPKAMFYRPIEVRILLQELGFIAKPNT